MKGICFIEPLFHEVAEGTKTQTRRILTPQPLAVFYGLPIESYDSKKGLKSASPRYKRGETLYLKEPYAFEADGQLVYKYSSCEANGYRWKNKLFMPEKYARYFIAITGVRAERLQYISDDDCLKEGIRLRYVELAFYHHYDATSRYYCAKCEPTGRKRLIKEALESKKEFLLGALTGYSCGNRFSHRAVECNMCGKTLSAFENGLTKTLFRSPIEAYAELIDKINGRGTWQKNPYVVVYDFQLIGKEGQRRNEVEFLNC
jgi:hypothetical protein